MGLSKVVSGHLALQAFRVLVNANCRFVHKRFNGLKRNVRRSSGRSEPRRLLAHPPAPLLRVSSAASAASA